MLQKPAWPGLWIALCRWYTRYGVFPKRRLMMSTSPSTLGWSYLPLNGSLCAARHRSSLYRGDDWLAMPDSGALDEESERVIWSCAFCDVCLKCLRTWATGSQTSVPPRLLQKPQTQSRQPEESSSETQVTTEDLAWIQISRVSLPSAFIFQLPWSMESEARS